MSEWQTGQPQPWSNHDKEPLKAKPHCCEEASTLSHNFYIPCNNQALYIVGWKGRNDKPIRMCEMCADHNVKNRYGYIVEPYSAPVQSAEWPKQNPNVLQPMAEPPAKWPEVQKALANGEHEPLLPIGDSKHMQSLNPWDSMNEDALLMLWQQKKDAIEKAKAEEMDLRKYIVGREFPKKQEGMNNKELGNGYTLKAGIKYNYKLADNDTVEDVLNKMSALGNQGSFIADRIVSWTPNFLLTEYRQLQEDAEKGSGFAKQALDLINGMLTITEAAPTLEIKEPKAKGKK